MATSNVQRPDLFRPLRVPINGKHAHRARVLISPADADLLEYGWWMDDGGYVACHHIGRLHTAVLLRSQGEPAEPGMEPDHVNRDPMDNRRENLRWATKNQNLRNRRFKTTKGYRGINRLKYTDGTPFYQPALYVDGKQVQLGSYPDEETAARIYDAYAAVYYGPFAVFNFPDETAWGLAECERVRRACLRRKGWAKPPHVKLDAMLAERGLPPRSVFP